jgi:dephospho-CoA kinase
VLRIGLTGGIACGKSEVASRFRALGLETLDLDGLAHKLMAPGRPAHADVVAAFGPGILTADGSIDRRALGAIVFSNPAARERLNAIVHPRVRAEEEARALTLSSRPRSVLVTDAALLVEAGIHLRFDRLVVVHCRPDQQVARLRERGLSEEEARARVAAQMPIEVKRRFAHLTVDSSQELAATHAAAEGLARLFPGVAASRPSPLRLLRRHAVGALVHGPSHGPRGLTPALLAAHLAEAGGLDLVRLARALDPPKPGAWYEPVAPDATLRPAGQGAPGAVTLSPPLVLFELARHGHDPDRIAAAAHSLAWLVDPDPGHIADSVFMALVLAEGAVTGAPPAELERRAAPLRALAERWGQGEVGPIVPATLAAARRHPQDAKAAAEAGAASGVEPGLAGALVGVVSGAGEERAGPWEAFLRILETAPG